MDKNRFSSSLSNFEGKIRNPELRDSLSFFKNNFPSFKISIWSDSQVAVPLSLNVCLPSLGNYNNIDIREEEPVIFVFDLEDYPTRAPLVFTDRLDFPKDQLAHLYIATNDRPPAFCYIRGSRDEWYANKTIKDLLALIQNWLQDAATGELQLNGKNFDPLRLEGYSGTIIYDYDFFVDVVKKNMGIFPSYNFAFGLFERRSQKSRSTFKFLKLATVANISKVVEEFKEGLNNDGKSEVKKNLHFGYILWASGANTFSNYNVNLPRKWSEFRSFCDSFGVEVKEFESFLCNKDFNHFANFPVIVGIKRPSQLIGFSSDIEFINFQFTVFNKDKGESHFLNDVPIKFFAHNQPLTPGLASKISGIFPIKGLKMIYGCGALGSKIAMHFARGGQIDMVLNDPDSLSPHNLVRHSLLADNLGENKAIALAKEINAIYSDIDSNFTVGHKGFNFDDDTKSKVIKLISWIFDFTASPAFFNKLVVSKSIEHVRVVTSSISDSGNLGLTMVEGETRNPRIDDLQVYLYSRFEENPEIEAWLKREIITQDHSKLDVVVGVGCNSETTVLSDSSVSSHAAFSAGVLNGLLVSPPVHGLIYLQRIKKEPFFKIETEQIEVKAFKVFNAVNNANWEIRFASNVLETMREQMITSGKNETGGVLIGISNAKTRTIHVVNLLPAPLDSQVTPVCFFRGVKGLPGAIRMVTENSGGQLGYIGEWHSHPHGPESVSETDLKTVQRFKAEFDKLRSPLPVFLTILTPEKILPFVF
ncbi:ThiF family protein [Algoriphagus aquaeductus]|uniref:ThiF family protein n=1 Tax=Algoriphagus aquaeductus TaxID=475299 RepID=A0A326RZK1_9BACT|nr:ThiF family adenylyltransferase [Algoriphagus aquaeductus]PZV82289.1 ThiF family protein [Algoriphagus aquaeductus]